MLLGLELLVERGWGMVEVETDCLEAVRMVNGSEDCFAEEGVLVEKIRSLLASIGMNGFSYVLKSLEW